MGSGRLARSRNNARAAHALQRQRAENREQAASSSGATATSERGNFHNGHERTDAACLNTKASGGRGMREKMVI